MNPELFLKSLSYIKKKLEKEVQKKTEPFEKSELFMNFDSNRILIGDRKFIACLSLIVRMGVPHIGIYKINGDESYRFETLYYFIETCLKEGISKEQIDSLGEICQFGTEQWITFLEDSWTAKSCDDFARQMLKDLEFLFGELEELFVEMGYCA